MKATGIVRRIDDLGRVVIPKEIRRTLRLREGTPLEIFTDREGEIILIKYSPMMELNAFAGQYADAMAQSTGLLVCITDRDQVVAAAGGAKKDFFQKPISRALEHVIQERTVIQAGRFSYPAPISPQKVQPPTPAEPSLLGQVKGSATGNL